MSALLRAPSGDDLDTARFLPCRQQISKQVDNYLCSSVVQQTLVKFSTTSVAGHRKSEKNYKGEFDFGESRI